MVQITDFVAETRKTIFQYREERKHPADINALVNGVCSGFHFASIFMKYSQEMNEDLLAIISDDEETIHELLAKANEFLPKDEFNSSFFEAIDYRKSLSFEAYRKGIQEGFRYAMKCAEYYCESLKLKDALALTLDQITSTLIQITKIVNSD